MITSKPSLRSGFDCIFRPAPPGAGRTTPSQPGHYPLNITWCEFHLKEHEQVKSGNMSPQSFGMGWKNNSQQSVMKRQSEIAYLPNFPNMMIILMLIITTLVKWFWNLKVSLRCVVGNYVNDSLMKIPVTLACMSYWVMINMWCLWHMIIEKQITGWSPTNKVPKAPSTPIGTPMRPRFTNDHAIAHQQAKMQLVFAEF